MVVDEKKITLDEYMQMPIGAPYQYINGRLVDWPSRTISHQNALMSFCHLFANYFDRTHNKGLFFLGPLEVILDDQNSFQPDFLYIAEENLQIVKDYVYGPPDLVAEVLWEKNAYYDLRAKKDTYEKYGVKEYIVIDPIGLITELYAIKDGAYYLHQKAQKDEQLNSVLLPGFSIDLSKLFAI